jgi:two-component system sensor histidine kinase/response regulator
MPWHKLKGARVLLVEDNDMNQELAWSCLNESPWTVVLARQRPGSAGRSGVVTRDFDGVLMDCQMPVMDGYTATRAIIRQNPALQRPAHHRHDRQCHGG